MEQDTGNFRVQSAITYKPKVITKENFKKLKKEGEHQLVFYPQYVEVIKTKKKGKDYTKRFIRLSDVTKVTTEDKDKNLLRVFVKNNRGDIECHQISIDNSAEFKIAKDYFEKKTQNGTSGRNSPMEALLSERQPTSIMSGKAGSRRPPSGRWAPAEEEENEEEDEEDLRPVDGGFGGGAYSQHLPIARSGYRSYDRMSGAPSDMVESYISTSDRPRSSRPRYNGYQDEDTGTGDDFNSEFDPQTRHPRYKSSYVHAQAPHSHAGRHYSRGGSTVYDGEDFRDYPRDYPGSAYDDHDDDDGAGYSEEDEETYTVDYVPHSNRVIERPNRPRSLPYYVPFLSVPHSRNAYW